MQCFQSVNDAQVKNTLVCRMHRNPDRDKIPIRERRSAAHMGAAGICSVEVTVAVNHTASTAAVSNICHVRTAVMEYVYQWFSAGRLGAER